MKPSKTWKRIPVLFLTGVAAFALTAFSNLPQETEYRDNCFAGQDLETLHQVGQSIHEDLLSGDDVKEETILFWMSAVQGYCSNQDPKSKESNDIRRAVEFQYDLMVNALFKNPSTSSNSNNAGLLLPLF